MADTRASTATDGGGAARGSLPPRSTLDTPSASSTTTETPTAHPALRRARSTASEGGGGATPASLTPRKRGPHIIDAESGALLNRQRVVSTAANASTTAGDGSPASSVANNKNNNLRQRSTADLPPVLLSRRGWLRKQYTKLRYSSGWHRRYFVCNNGTVQYFKRNPKSTSEKARGEVLLGVGCRVEFSGTIDPDSQEYQFSVVFDDATMPALLMAASSPEDAAAWVNVLRKNIEYINQMVHAIDETSGLLPNSPAASSLSASSRAETKFSSSADPVVNRRSLLLRGRAASFLQFSDGEEDDDEDDIKTKKKSGDAAARKSSNGDTRGREKAAQSSLGRVAVHRGPSTHDGSGGSVASSSTNTVTTDRPDRSPATKAAVAHLAERRMYSSMPPAGDSQGAWAMPPAEPTDEPRGDPALAWFEDVDNDADAMLDTLLDNTPRSFGTLLSYLHEIRRPRPGWTVVFPGDAAPNRYPTARVFRDSTSAHVAALMAATRPARGGGPALPALPDPLIARQLVAGSPRDVLALLQDVSEARQKWDPGFLRGFVRDRFTSTDDVLRDCTDKAEPKEEDLGCCWGGRVSSSSSHSGGGGDPAALKGIGRDSVTIVTRPLPAYPPLPAVSSRSFRLDRFWKTFDNGCAAMVFDTEGGGGGGSSSSSRDKDRVGGTVAGRMRGGFWVEPVVPSSLLSPAASCVVTLALQLDPMGWVGSGAPVGGALSGGLGKRLAQRAMECVSGLCRMVGEGSRAQRHRAASTTRSASLSASVATSSASTSPAAVPQTALEMSRVGRGAVDTKKYEDDDDDDDDEDEDDIGNNEGVTAGPSLRDIDALAMSLSRLTHVPDPPDTTDTSTALCWSRTDCTVFQVRGPNYLEDRVKVASQPACLHLVAVDLTQRTGEHALEPVPRICWVPGSVTQLVQQEYLAAGAGADAMPFYFVINFLVPGGMNTVMWFRVPEPDEANGDCTQVRMLREFMSTDVDDEFRDSRLKIIPSVVEGTWMVKRGVGNKPAIIGKKVTQAYHRGPRWVEVDIDIESSRVAGAIMGLVKNYTKSLVIDIAFVLESKTAAELPERVLGSARFHRVDLGALMPPPS